MTIKPSEDKRSKQQESIPFELILMNDAVNSFDFVIEKLIEHCKHGPEQAEQSALITHHNGECSILLGTEDMVEEIAKKLSTDGLLVDVRKVTV